MLIMEVTRPKDPIRRWLFRFYFGSLYPLFTRLFTRSKDAQKMMLYFWETMDACVPPEDVLASLSAAGFKQVNRYPLAGFFSEYVAVKS